MCMSISLVFQMSEEGVGFPGTRVMNAVNYYVGTGNGIWVSATNVLS